MRTILPPLAAAVLALSACGSSNKDGAAAAAVVAPEVARLNVDQLCFRDKCSLRFTGGYSDGSTRLSAPYSLTVAIAEGATAPAMCDATSAGETTGTYAHVDDLKAGTPYTLRGCVFDGKTYSTGVTLPFTTKAAG